MFRKNPQLKRLKTYYITQQHIEQIAEHLKDLEELVLVNNIIDNCYPLRKLKKLNNLRLNDIHWEKADEILSSLSSLSNIRALKVSLPTYGRLPPSPNHLISIARTIKNLEEFSIAFLPMNATVIFDFIRIAENLKVLHVHKSGVDFDLNLLIQIDQWRRKSGHGKDIPLKIFTEDENCKEVSVSDKKKMIFILTKNVFIFQVNQLFTAIVWKKCTCCCMFTKFYSKKFNCCTIETISHF